MGTFLKSSEGDIIIKFQQVAGLVLLQYRLLTHG
jgi:hypothetical protein